MLYQFGKLPHQALMVLARRCNKYPVPRLIGICQHELEAAVKVTRQAAEHALCNKSIALEQRLNKPYMLVERYFILYQDLPVS